MTRPAGLFAVALLAATGAAAVEHVVIVADYTFTPPVVLAAPGDTVRWTYAGGGHHHNVVADAGSFRCAKGCDGQGGDGTPDDAAWSFSLPFPVAGDFPYFCEVHGGPGGIAMAGSVVVAQAGACESEPTALCLGDGRFRVRANWQTPDGQSGAANGVKLTSDTGYFWFFSESNVEVVVKVLDGCGLNERFWVFAGGLTNVQVTLTVVDTTNGAGKTYINEQGKQFQPIQDTGAFPTCS